MAAEAARLEALSARAIPDRGRRGGFLRVTVLAPGLHLWRNVAVSGTGVTARVEGADGADRLNLTLDIAPDAPTGWRDFDLSSTGDRLTLPRLFEVLAPASSSGGAGWRGIGAHMI